MECLLDEIRVMQEEREMCVSIIPPDELSSEPFLQELFARDSQAWQIIVDGLLPLISPKLRISSRIKAAVHGGGDKYTLITSDEEYIEVCADSHPNVLSLLQRIADFVAPSMLVPHNTVSSERISLCGSPISPVMNRITGGRRLARRLEWKRPQEVWDGPVNPFPKPVERDGPRLSAPNKLIRSA